MLRPFAAKRCIAISVICYPILQLLYLLMLLVSIQQTMKDKRALKSEELESDTDLILK